MASSIDSQPTPLTAYAARFLARYFWIILKNVIGWALIFSALVIGGVFPGPLGTPIFLIGFALITLPGKRTLTSRLLRGIPYDLSTRAMRIVRAGIALLLPPLALVFFTQSPRSMLSPAHLGHGATVAVYVMAIAGMWIAAHWVLRGMNVLIGFLPKVRRRVRPWLKRHGINLLPPRRKPRLPGQLGRTERRDQDEILTINADPVQQARDLGRSIQHAGENATSYLLARFKLIFGILITLAIFGWMFWPIYHRWASVHDRVMHTSLTRLLIAAGMFASFLFVFRVTSWRAIVAACGRKLPLAAAARIWSTSELARYLPGVIWQVVGRAYLVKPYGVSAATSSTSQVLELSIFLLANVLMSIGCLCWCAAKLGEQSHTWFWIATGLVPILLALLHPRIFYSAVNSVLRRMGKAAVNCRLGGFGLLALVGWALLGLAWQAMGIWLLMAQPQALKLTVDGLVLVVGAYCLAWCAGFLAFWSPGGIGMRELVFVTTLMFTLPPHYRNDFVSLGAFKLFLSFLSVLLRLWTILGELILCGLAYLTDFRGALARPDAPGRVKAPSATAID